MHKYISCIIISVFFLRCGTSPLDANKDELLTEINIDFSDPLVTKIFDHQDALEEDSLIQYFRYRDPTYRYLAASAFASIQSSKYLDTLSTLLRDPISEVRQAAAYSIGQIRSPQAESVLIKAFQNHDTLDANSLLNATILEAIGKCGSLSTLALISQVSTYKPDDHHLLLGQARAIYRFMLRDLVHPDGTQRMINMLGDPKNALEIRILAVNYLSRGNVDLQMHADILSLIYSNEKNAEVLLFLPQVLIKSSAVTIPDLLRSSLTEENDYRVKCNAIRAMAKHDYVLFRRDIHRKLYDENPQVSRIASDCVVAHGRSGFWREYMNLSLDDFPWPIKINLLHAVNKFIPAGNGMFRDINDQKLQQRIRNSDDEFEQSAAILALAENQNQYRFVTKLLNNSGSKLVRSACTKSLLNIANKSNFTRFRNDLRKNVIDQLIIALGSGDVGQVEIASGLFDITNLSLADYGYADPSILLQEAANKLDLPRDMEAHIALKNKLAKLAGTEYDATDDVVHTHRIDWNQITNITDSSRVKIRTTRGLITIQLFPKTAPGTVANFVDLVSLNYFAGKNFHRVVPVFVIQGGCNRGDGYGSMDYNIRSELNQLYYNKSGYIGMASAGNHTESAQWFITHSATPHLDGRYTIFGQVVNGMEVADQIQVGDQIEQIIIE